MRLALKFAGLLLLLAVTASSVIAATHCIALQNADGSGSAPLLTLGHSTHDDCSFHENAASANLANAATANLGSDSKISVVGPASFVPISIALAFATLPFASLASELVQAASLRTLSSVLRI